MTKQPKDSILKPFHWRTSISWKSVDKITIRGYDVNELAENIGFADMIFLLFIGELPTKNQAAMLDHVMVTFVEHALSPSTVTARMCAAGRPPINAAIAAGILTFGDAHGPGQAFSDLLCGLMRDIDEKGLDMRKAAFQFVQERLDQGLKIYGVHQPQHTSGDPRAPAVSKRAKELGVAGRYCQLQQCIQDALVEIKGRELKPNLLGAAGPALLDLGFSPSACFSIGVLARGFGNAAHAIEEQDRESAWRASDRHGMADLMHLSLQGKENYDGPEDRSVPAPIKRGVTNG